jgi:hypothetical protein
MPIKSAPILKKTISIGITDTFLNLTSYKNLKMSACKTSEKKESSEAKKRLA